MTDKEDVKRKPGTGVKIFLSVISLLVLCFLIEGILSVVLYQQSGPEKLASIEIVKT